MNVAEILLGARAPRRARTRLLRGIVASRLTLEVDLGLGPRAAAVAFDSASLCAVDEGLLAAIAEDTGVRIRGATDEFGYEWLVLDGTALDDLAIATAIVAESFERADAW